MRRTNEVLPYGAQMSLAEIAQEEGISVGCVRMTINRALRKLRSEGITFKMQELGDELERNRKGSIEWQI